jgi:ligand-binding sensor domain-containing protein
LISATVNKINFRVRQLSESTEIPTQQYELLQDLSDKNSQNLVGAASITRSASGPVLPGVSAPLVHLDSAVQVSLEAARSASTVNITVEMFAKSSHIYITRCTGPNSYH